MIDKLLPLYRDSAVYQFLLWITGLPPRSLHMVIHGFVFEENTKPVDEHHLQVFHPLSSLRPFSLPGL
jgi:hypothetical protein